MPTRIASLWFLRLITVLVPLLGQVLPRSKLVRDPGSFGYRRLLPFLNEMAKNGNALSNSNSQHIVFLLWSGSHYLLSCSYAISWVVQMCLRGSGSSIGRSDSPSVDAPLGEIRCESDVMDSVEPVVAKAGGEPEVKDGCNFFDEVNTTPHDPASSKPVSSLLLHLVQLY